MVLADIVPRSAAKSMSGVSESSRKPDLKTLDLAAEEKVPPRFIVTFTEDKKGSYINGEKFTPDAAPMVRVKIGTLQHWRIVNATGELHPMHIHQVHFLDVHGMQFPFCIDNSPMLKRPNFYAHHRSSVWREFFSVDVKALLVFRECHNESRRHFLFRG